MNNNSGQQYYVELINSGLFVTRYSVTYTALSDRGTRQSDNILLGGIRRLYYPADSYSIRIVAEVLYLFVWIPYYDETFQFAKNYCYTAYGTWYFPFMVGRDCGGSSNTDHLNALYLQNQLLMNGLSNNCNSLGINPNIPCMNNALLGANCNSPCMNSNCSCISNGCSNISTNCLNMNNNNPTIINNMLSNINGNCSKMNNVNSNKCCSSSIADNMVSCINNNASCRCNNC